MCVHTAVLDLDLRVHVGPCVGPDVLEAACLKLRPPPRYVPGGLFVPGWQYYVLCMCKVTPDRKRFRYSAPLHRMGIAREIIRRRRVDRGGAVGCAQ